MKKIFIIDDDHENREQFERIYDPYDVKAFEPIYDAIDKPDPDLLVVDMSAVASLWSPELAYTPICRYIDRHPGVPVHVVSYVSRGTRQDVVDDILRRSPEALVSPGTLDYIEAKFARI